MKNQIILVIVFFLITSLNSNAQQALWGAPSIISPEVKSDNSVTFRFQAPAAREVKISGDWMPGEGWTPGAAVMAKDEKGLWSYTTAVMPSDLYSYS